MITLSLIGDVMGLADRLVTAVESIAESVHGVAFEVSETNKKLESIDRHLVELVDREPVGV